MGSSNNTAELAVLIFLLVLFGIILNVVVGFVGDVLKPYALMFCDFVQDNIY